MVVILLLTPCTSTATDTVTYNNNNNNNSSSSSSNNITNIHHRHNHQHNHSHSHRHSHSHSHSQRHSHRHSQNTEFLSNQNKNNNSNNQQQANVNDVVSSNDSSNVSTASTGDTAIPTATYRTQQQQQQQRQQQRLLQNTAKHSNNNNNNNNKNQTTTNHAAAVVVVVNSGSGSGNNELHTKYKQHKHSSHHYQQHLPLYTSNTPPHYQEQQTSHSYNAYTHMDQPTLLSLRLQVPATQSRPEQWTTSGATKRSLPPPAISETSSSPPPPPLPKSKPPYNAYYTKTNWPTSGDIVYGAANVVPKPPRGWQHPTYTQPYAQEQFYQSRMPPQQQQIPNQYASPRSRPNYTNTTDYVRHVTRVNFYDIDTSQVEFEPKDDDDEDNDVDNKNCDTEAITKDEEWITKRKTELTTTRQIETRVKRNVVLEDGKVIEDSGPIVSTNTTEDTDKQETETTEKRDLGIPNDVVDGENTAVAGNAAALEANSALVGEPDALAPLNALGTTEDGGGKLVRRMVPRPIDGLVRQTDEKRVISHEEIKDYLETEDVRHLGDFSDETYVNAINSGVENLQDVLLSAESQKQLVPLGPRIVANTSKSRKTIDSEDTQKRCLAQPDGTLVTENKKTTEHEVIIDEELPEKDDRSTGSREKLITTEASQRYYKQRDEQHVDLVADGKVISTEMRYAAETMQMDKDGSLERPGDWDSLSDRMRKLRRPQPKAMLQQQKEVALLADRKDALTKRPLDFDREEETRKGETMKWLESHFGSESTASNDSREDDAEVEPTKKTYFNVTIKSNQAQTTNQATIPRGAATNATSTAAGYERKYSKERDVPGTVNTNGAGGGAKFYHGISNWAERKEAPRNHFSSQAFRDDLQETIRRNGLKKTSAPSAGVTGVGVNSSAVNDNYVSKEDILQQKRQSLSSQFLAKSTRGSRDALDDLDAIPGSRELPRTTLASTVRYGLSKPELEHKRSIYGRQPSIVDARGSTTNLMNGTAGQKNGTASVGYNVAARKSRDLHDGRAKSCERELESMDYSYDRLPYDSQTLSNKPKPDGVQTLGRPTVPQRRRAIEKKLREQSVNLTSIASPKLQTQQHDQYHHQSAQIHQKLHSRSGSRDLIEPPPDYSPPPRSRSSSPQIDYITRSRSNINMPSASGDTGVMATSTLTRKQHQRTRFAPTTPVATSSYAHNGGGQHTLQRSTMATQTTQTSSGTTATPHKSHKMGQVIGNSLRKLVSKIRSASAERKFRMKSSSSKSRDHSPTSHHAPSERQLGSTTTYQQYNVIDGHIGGQQGGGSNESEPESARQVPIRSNKTESSLYSNSTIIERNANTQKAAIGYKRGESADPYDAEAVNSPRQRYYLGEDPYSSSLYGKENIYDPNAVGNRQQRNEPINVTGAGYPPRESKRQATEDDYYNSGTTTHTLGRYQKSGQRFTSTPNLHHEYRSAQTLPRKLNEHSQYRQQQQQRAAPRYIHSAIYANTPSSQQQQQQPVPQQQQPQQYAGPAKPARSYAKVLHRSKSFNVHGMNGGNDPSPIYIEKLTKNNYNGGGNGYSYSQQPGNAGGSNLQMSQTYKSNPHLYTQENSLQNGLKSPSIVNLISRSQKDLTKLDLNEEREQLHYSQQEQHQHQPQSIQHKALRSMPRTEDKKQIFLRGLHQQAPDLYKTLHGDDDDYKVQVPSSHGKFQLQPKYSLDSRSPIEINKDTASIVRRGSTSNNDYHYHHHQQHQQHQHHHTDAKSNKRIIMYKDDEQHMRRGSGSTIIEVRNIDNRK